MAEFRTSGFRYGEQVSVSNLSPLDAIRGLRVWCYVRQRRRLGNIEHLVTLEAEWPKGQQIPFRFCAARCAGDEEERTPEFNYGDVVTVSDASQEVARRSTSSVYRYVSYRPESNYPHLVVADEMWPSGPVTSWKFCAPTKEATTEARRKLLLHLYASGEPYVVRDATSDGETGPWQPIAWALTLRPPFPDRVEVAQVAKDGAIVGVHDLWK